MFKVNNKDTRTTIPEHIKIPEHISHLVLVFLLLTLNMQLAAGNITLNLGYASLGKS